MILRRCPAEPSANQPAAGVSDDVLPPLAEEALQKIGGLALAQAAIDLRPVVAGRLLENARAMIHAAALGIVGAVIDPSEPREGDRLGAHGTRFQRDVEVGLR